MITLNARKICRREPNELYTRIVSPPGEKILVVFDDGEMELTATEIIASSYYWLFNRRDSDFPLLKKYVTTGRFEASVPVNLFNMVLWDYVDYLNDHGYPSDVYEEGLVKAICRENNNLHNDICEFTSAHWKSIDITDFIDAAYHPDILKLRVDRKKAIRLAGGEIVTTTDQKAISHVLDRAADIMDDGLVRQDGNGLNTLSWLIGIKALKNDQTLQSMVFRGYLKDLNTELIEFPIENNLLEGMNTTTMSMVLNREGALALFNNKRDLGAITAAGRVLTLAAMYKTRLISGDCGTKGYSLHHIANDKEFYTILGATIIDKKGMQSTVSESDTHLIGTTIRRRSTIHCILPNPKHVCKTCFGGLSDSMRLDEGIGTLLSKYFTQDGIQKTLSAKHFMKSIAEMVHSLSPEAKGFLVIRQGKIMLAPANAKRTVILTILRRDFMGKGYLEQSNIRGLPIGKISCLKTCDIEIQKKRGKPLVSEISLTNNKFGVHFSADMLTYIKTNPDCIQEYANDYYRITLTDYDHTRPFFLIPAKSTGLLEFFREVINLYTRGMMDKQANRRRTGKADFSHVASTADSINSKLLEQTPINVAITELFLAAFISHYPDPDDPNTSLMTTPEAEGSYHIKGLKLAMDRSLTTKLLDNKQSKPISTLSSYLSTARDDCALDVLVDTRGVLGIKD